MRGSRGRKKEHGYQIEFLHLDRLVEWIVKGRLLTELKVALAEIQQPATKSSKRRTEGAGKTAARKKKVEAARPKK
jgi:hypothetical protein